ASALMQGLADGYFVVPLSVGGYLAGSRLRPVGHGDDAVRGAVAESELRIRKLVRPRGARTANDVHRTLGDILSGACGLVRNAPGLEQAIARILDLRGDLDDVIVPSGDREPNPELEQKARVSDFVELGELMCRDALAREESCGSHLREEHLGPDGEP